MDQLSLTSYQPIVGALVELSQDFMGWRLAIRHRHYSGRFGECEPTVFEELTLGEALDVIDATLCTLHTTPSPLVAAFLRGAERGEPRLPLRD